MARYKVSFWIFDGKNIETVTRLMVRSVSNAFGVAIGSQTKIEKIEDKPKSHIERFTDATDKISDAASEIGDLRDELQGWRDNLPENLDGSEKASQLDEAIDSLTDMVDNLDESKMAEVDFPGMMG